MLFLLHIVYWEICSGSDTANKALKNKIFKYYADCVVIFSIFRMSDGLSKDLFITISAIRL